MKKVVDLCLSTNINYDLVLITRFDLLFQKNFMRVTYNSINLTWFLC